MLGNRKSHTDGLGRVRKYEYDNGGAGFMTRDTDALNRVTTYASRTIYGSPLSITYPDGKFESWTRDNLDQMLTHTDELGRVTTYTRDANHRITRIDHPDASFETFTYNSFGEILSHTQRNGGTESNTYDSRGMRTSYTDAQSNVTTFGYDASDRLASLTDARGNTTSYQYDERGLLTKKTHPDLSFQSYTYDAFGNRLTLTDELGHTWTTTYDEFRRPLTTTDPLSRTTQYAYDLPGGVCGCTNERQTPTSITLPSGRITRYTYDVEWQRTSETTGANTPDSATTSYEYDMVGNLVKTVDPRGKEWNYEYDLRDRKTAEVDPLLHRSEWTYDADGNNLTMKRPDGGTTVYVYDAMNRRTKSTDPKSQVIQYTYDADGNVLTLTDPKSNVYSYQYDLMDRQTRMTYPGGTIEQYTYDAVGNLATYTNRAGTVRSYTYDSRNRQTLSDWNDATPDVSRSYDADSRLLSVSSSISTITYTYDNAHHLLSEAQNIAGSGGGTKTTTYTYNTDGFRTSMTYPGGSTVSYSYSGRNQTSTITDGAAPPVVTYTYDLNGNRINKTLSNGTTTTYTYNDDNRTLTVDHKLGATSFSRYDYGYDNVHRRIFQQRDLSTGDVYSYDAVDQVTQVLYDATNPGGVPSAPVRTVSYGLDASGNRTTVTDNAVPLSYTSNNLNQYTLIGGNAYTYNGNGSLASGGGWTYVYDAQNRLTSATNGTTTELFAYDGLNRNVRRSINGTPVYYYYDRWNIVEEKDGSDGLLQRYVYGAMTDEILTKTSSGTSVFYHYDALGSVVRLTSTIGAVVERYAYDVFGDVSFRNGAGNPVAASAFANRFLFTGREYMIETNLYNYRNRMYRADIGRFLQVDPLNFDVGELNLYRYVGNNPVNLVDPDGMKCEDPCGDAKTAGLAKTSIAGVVCCCNKKYSCIWKANGSATGAANAEAIKIINRCTIAHEDVHHDHIDCPKDEEGKVCRPAFKAGVSAKDGELAAYTAEKKCLTDNKKDCKGNADCEKEVDTEAREIDKRIVDNSK